MAKLVSDSDNRFRHTWERARDQGVSRKVLADSLGISQKRLSSLVSGAQRPSLGEISALTHKRRATLVRYEDELGAGHSFYTGRGASVESLMERGDWVDIAGEIADKNSYAPMDHALKFEERYPRFPQQVGIYHGSRSIREQTGGVRKYG